MKLTQNEKSEALSFFSSIQQDLKKAFEALDGHAQLELTPWKRPEGGGGTMGVLRGGVVEKAGVNVSEVYGSSFPAINPEHGGKPFFAAGVSTITHMFNPHAPIGHMNVRLIEAGDEAWVGGGADLTPFLVYPEDTEAFHSVLKEACDAYSPDAYSLFSKQCDEYFYIAHRHSIRGVGGVFFDYLKGDFRSLFGLLQGVAKAYVKVFPEILERRKNLAFSESEKEGQLYWRGRYVEFNLIYDRGTSFGLKSGGNVEAIFVSLPPVVKW